MWSLETILIWHGRYIAMWWISALFIMPIFDIGVLGNMTLAMKYCDMDILIRKMKKKIADIVNIGNISTKQRHLC